MATNEEMIELLKEIRSGLKNEIEIKDMQYLLHYFWRSDIPIIDSILAALEPKVTEWTPDRPCPKEEAELSGLEKKG